MLDKNLPKARSETGANLLGTMGTEQLEAHTQKRQPKHIKRAHRSPLLKFSCTTVQR